MAKTERTLFDIEQDICEFHKKMEKATRRKDFVNINIYARRIAEATKEKENLLADKKFLLQEKNMDRNLVNWAGKTLALMLNMSDMAIYYYDLYMKFHRERGFYPSPEWAKKSENLKRSAKELREFVSYFFKDENINAYFAQMADLMEIISKQVFTDRERMYLEKYENSR